MNTTEIKKRDKWRCKSCGAKFIVDAVQFDGDCKDKNNWITLCLACVDKFTAANSQKFTLEAIEICRKALKINKIILVGDIHGKFEDLDKALSTEYPFDFFLSVGDVGSLKDVSPANIGIIDKWGKHGWYIKGNHDDCSFFHGLGLHQELNGIQVAALNGMIRSKRFVNGAGCITFGEVLYLSHQKDVDILVTHQAPSMMFKGNGEIILTELLNYMTPKIYIFGHTHKNKLKFYLRTFCI